MPATPVLWRDLGQVNSVDILGDTGLQRQARAIQMADGNILVVWESNTNAGAGTPAGFDIIGQLLSPTGERISGEMRLNTGWFADDEITPSVIADNNGGFVVVFTDQDATSSSIRLELFDYDSMHQQSVTIQQDQATGTPPNYSDPVVAFGNGNEALIVYKKDNGNGDVDVVGRIWNSFTGVVGNEKVLFDGSMSGGIESLSVTALNNGDYVVSFSDEDGPEDSDIETILVNPTGTVIGLDETAIGDGRHDDATVTALTGGGSVVAWTEGGDVYFTQYTSSLGVMRSAEPVNTITTEIQSSPSVAALGDGGFVIAWIDEERNDLRFRSFTNAGNAEGIEVIVDDLLSNGSEGVLSDVQAKGTNDGRIIITYTVTIGTDSDVFSKIYDPRDSVPAGQNGNDTLVGMQSGELLEGGYGNDALYGWGGNDTLAGGQSGEADTLIGGIGNDIYIDPQGDIIIEVADAGTDRVQTGATFSLAALEHVEEIALTGSANANASGNAGANKLFGNGGNNILNGGGGADTMIGGAGNDTYYVDHAGDVTTELFGEGTDIISSSVSRTLSVNIENLNLSGAANIDGNGNTGANKINGNTGNNILRGYEGTDTLNGGEGSDILLGGTGSDSLNPGSDAVKDTIRFSAVGDSTGSQRDIITGLDLTNEDRLDFTVVPTSLTFVGTGALNLASINANLAAAVDGALEANGAVLFDPNAGDMNVGGHLFIVVDANGDGVYKPNQDYVVQLVNSTGFLTLDDFV